MASPQSSPQSIATNFLEALRVQTRAIFPDEPPPGEFNGLLIINVEGPQVNDVLSAKDFKDIQEYLKNNQTILQVISSTVQAKLTVVQEKSLNIQNAFKSHKTPDKDNVQESYVFNYGALVYITKILTNLYNAVSFAQVTQKVPGQNASTQTSSTTSINAATNAPTQVTNAGQTKMALTAQIMILRIQRDKLKAQLTKQKNDLENLLKTVGDENNKLKENIQKLNDNISKLLAALESRNEHIEDLQANATASNKAMQMLQDELLRLQAELLKLKQQQKELDGLRRQLSEELQRDITDLQSIVNAYKSPNTKQTSETISNARKESLLKEINAIMAYLNGENMRLQENLKIADKQIQNAEDFAKGQMGIVDEEMKFKEAYYAMRNIAAKAIAFNFE